jgi:hypothetical protein
MLAVCTRLAPDTKAAEAERYDPTHFSRQTRSVLLQTREQLEVIMLI